jgi:WD40 repeat protein
MIALAKDPQERFSSVQVFATALEQANDPARFQTFAPSASSLEPTVAAIPPTQHPWPTIAVPSSWSALQLSSSDTSISPSKPRLADHTISRRAMVTGLVGLAVAGVSSGIAWLALSQKSQVTPISSSSNRVLNTTPTSTSAPNSLSIGTTLLTYRGHSAPVLAVSWSHDGTRIASGGRDRTVQV